MVSKAQHSSKFRLDVDRFSDEIGAVVVFDQFQRIKLIVIEVKFPVLIVQELGEGIIDRLVSFT